MQAEVSRCGEDLVLRFPDEITTQAKLHEGQPVEVVIEGNRIIIVPKHARYTLADLLEGLSPRLMREAFDWDAEDSREVGK